MPWLTKLWLHCFFLALSTGATRSTIGAYLSDHWPALPAPVLQTLCRRIQRSDDSSCIWCFCPCLRQQEATAVTTDISMSSNGDGMDVALNRFLLQPGPPYIHLDSTRFKIGVRNVTLPLHIICGSLPPSASCAVVPRHWTHLTSQALSQRSRPRSRTALRPLCLGKHLRARRLRPQARHKPRRKRLRKRNQPWRRQVIARLCTTLAGWPTWLAPCAHWLASFRCVLLLQQVAPFMRFVASRSANARAKKALNGPHSTQAMLWGQTALRPARHQTSPALPTHSFRVRLPNTACHLWLHTLTLRVSLLSCSRLPLPFLCSATMDPLRDPLHDSALEEALADAGTADTTAATTVPTAIGALGEEAEAASDASAEGSVHSTFSAAMEAADRSPSPDRLGHGPYGPPPAVPVNALVRHPLARQYLPALSSTPTRPLTLPTGFLGFVHRPRPTAPEATGSSSSARGPPTTPQMPGEPDDPHWQRVMAVNVLNTLQHTGPAFVHAPTLATVKSWSALRIVLEEATDMDDICCQRVDPQDLNNPLHLTGPLGAGTVTDNEQEDNEEEQPDGEEGEEEEACSPDDDNNDTDAPGAPDGPDGSTGPLTTRSGTTLGGSGSGDSGAPGMGALDHTDPLTHAEPSTAIAAATPFSVLPGDLIYEVDDISFNLSAAGRCLLSTRQEVARMRERNRHRRSGGDGEPSRSRSRTPPRGSEDATRPELCPNYYSLQTLSLTPTWTEHTGDKSAPALLRPSSQVDASKPRLNALPEISKMQPSAVHVYTTFDVFTSSVASLPSPKRSGYHLQHCQHCRYIHAKAPLSTLQAWLVLTVWLTSCARLVFQLASRVCYVSPRACTHDGPGHSLASPSALGSASRPSTSMPSAESCPGRQASLQASPTLHTSRLGPNSQGLTVLHLLFLFFVVLIQPACAGSGAEARVAVPAAGTAGGASTLPYTHLAPKPGSLPNTMCPTPKQAHTRCVKRSFKRACARAVHQGTTLYRGRVLRASEVPSSLQFSRSSQPRRSPVNQTPQRGLRIFCWNAGGLGGGLYPELLTFLTASRYDAAIILESKWQDTMEYTTGPWSCLHSGCKTRKQAGILILIHHRVAPPSQLRFDHILLGRLLHVRIPLPGKDSRHLHLIGIYQKAYDQKATTSDQRHQVWQALDRCLSRVPARDSLALAGDFNTPLKPQWRHVGPHTCALPCHPPEDMEAFSSLLTSHDLVALNTWHRPPDRQPPSTFRFQDLESQIDFILTRHADANDQARRAHALRRFHVGASRHAGAVHFPLQAHLILRCPHWIKHPPRAQASIDREALLQALDSPTEPAHLARISEIRQRIAHHMASTEGIDGVSRLHQTLYQACVAVFPASRKTAEPKPWQLESVQRGIKDMWLQWRAFKKIRKNGLRGRFAAWMAWKAFDKLYRAHQVRCRVTRRAKLLTAMAEAQQCADKHDSRGLYQIVKRIAPKQAYRRLQLKDSQGRMMSPSDEADLLQWHFSERFSAPSGAEESSLNLQGPWSLQHPLLLDAFSLCRELQQIPRRKAVPMLHPPGAAWRLCADMIAPWISHELSQAWTEQQIHVPASWSDVDLALILKPDKGGHKPGDYRPIGLSCPLGKKLLRCIIEPHLDDILGQIRRYPQFAYQKGRSQYDALRKVFTHCAAARAELSKHHKNLHHQWEGHKSAPLFGSLMVTVDLSQAFDKMPRKLLLQGMIDLQLPADLIAIVMAWHAHIHYTVHHSGESRTFAATQGIRQGCSASPILWLIFSHAISSRLEESLGYERLCSLLTIFADDYLAAGVFTTLHELEQLLSCVTVLFKVLRTFGMAVSDTKSQAIIALRGTLAPSIRRRYTRKGQDGLMLRLPMHGDSLRIPLVQQFRYLGAQVSYASFEDATLAFRMQKSDAMYGRLGTALRGRHHLTSAQRIRLWHACMWSTMSYSLTTCGLTPAGHRLLETKVVQQLRAILRLPVHLTHTSNLEVMQQAGLTLPCVTLAALMDTEGQRKPPDQDDHLCRPGQAWWIKVRESLNAPPTSSHIIPVPTPVQPQVCPECGVSYNTRAALLTHIARHHHEMIDQAPPEPYQQQQDSVGGLPQCSHCKKKFPTWQLLKRHVEGNYCSVRHSFLPQPPETDVADHTQHDSAPGTEMPPTFDAQPVQTLIAQYAANAIFHLSDRHQYRQHCLICGQWVASSKVMKLHYKHKHPDLVSKHQAKASTLCASYTGCGTPCLYCGASVAIPRLHKLSCTVLWQFCLSFEAQHGEHRDGSGDQRSLRESCPEQHDSVRGGPLRGKSEFHPGQRTSFQGSQAGSTDGKAREGPRQSKLAWPKRSGLGSDQRQGQRQQDLAPDPSAGTRYGQADHQAGDPTSNPEAELSVEPLLAARTGRTCCPPLSGGSEVQGGSQNPVHGSAGACPPAPYIVSSPTQGSSKHQRRQQRTADPQGQGLAQCRGQLELSAVGRRAASPEGERGQTTHGPPGLNWQGRTANGAGIGQRCHTPVQCDAHPDTQQDRSGDLPSGSRAPSPGRGNNLEHVGAARRTLCPSGDRLANSSRGSSQGWPGQRRPEASLRIGRLVLHNPSNQCYINALAYAYLWCHHWLEAPEYQLFGESIQAWRDILYTTQRPLIISRLASWKHLLRGWRQPDAQHDVADFLSHILSIMQPPQLQARWEARLATMQGTACEDNGTLHTPIVLHIHSTHVTLQDCINAWHQQARPHALVAVPGLLFVQLARYRCTGSLTFKNRQSVVIPSQVTIPVFGRGIQIFNATFHTAAVISHHGAHTCTGHYTTLLFPNAADDRGHYWGTDDDRQAQLSESMPKHVQHDGYIVALIRRY